MTFQPSLTITASEYMHKWQWFFFRNGGGGSSMRDIEKEILQQIANNKLSLTKVQLLITF